MFNWSSEKFSGERLNFPDFKVELDTQLRMRNVYLIATGRETLPILAPQNASASVQAKVQEKREEFEHRNQLGFGIITMSVHRKLIYQLNRLPIQGCKEAYDFLNEKYGGELSTADFASLDILINKEMTKDETAEQYVLNYMELQRKVGSNRPADDKRMLAKLRKKFENNLNFVGVLKYCYLQDLNLDRTIELLIKEDEIIRSSIINMTNGKVNFNDNFTYIQNINSKTVESNNKYKNNNNKPYKSTNKLKYSSKDQSHVSPYKIKNSKYERQKYENNKNKIEDKLCWNFEKYGKCKYGTSCKFKHSS